MDVDALAASLPEPAPVGLMPFYGGEGALATAPPPGPGVRLLLAAALGAGLAAALGARRPLGLAVGAAAGLVASGALGRR